MHIERVRAMALQSENKELSIYKDNPSLAGEILASRANLDENKNINEQ